MKRLMIVLCMGVLPFTMSSAFAAERHTSPSHAQHQVHAVKKQVVKKKVKKVKDARYIYNSRYKNNRRYHWNGHRWVLNAAYHAKRH